jgi:hypothetical protein
MLPTGQARHADVEIASQLAVGKWATMRIGMTSAGLSRANVIYMQYAISEPYRSLVLAKSWECLCGFSLIGTRPFFSPASRDRPDHLSHSSNQLQCTYLHIWALIIAPSVHNPASSPAVYKVYTCKLHRTKLSTYDGTTEHPWGREHRHASEF